MCTSKEVISSRVSLSEFPFCSLGCFSEKKILNFC